MKAVNLIEVWAWGQRVGALAQDPRLGAYVFEYEEAWRRRGIELAPFTMPVMDSSPSFFFPNLDDATFHRLPGLISDSLPDSFGNHLIDVWMAHRGVPKGQITALDRLAYMGRSAMGALEFRPMRAATKESAAQIEIQRLVAEARSTIRAELSKGVLSRLALTDVITVGTAAGGAWPKAVVAWNRKTNELRSGQFDVNPGFEHWLLKLEGVEDDVESGKNPTSSGRREYAYYLMAKAAGVQMSESRIMKENGRTHFMTQRFDRIGNCKRHVQSLCGLQHLSYRQRATHAYESLFMTADKLGLGAEAMAQIFLRMTFNVAARNHDDHTKNFAFMMDKDQPWQLAPAFDLTPSIGDRPHQHQMSVNGKFDAIEEADLMTVASRFSVPSPRTLLDQVAAATARWMAFADQAELDAIHASEIQSLLMK